MAKIKLDFNSKNKAFNVTMDGQSLDDLAGLEYYTFETMEGVIVREVRLQRETRTKSGDLERQILIWSWRSDSQTEADFRIEKMNIDSNSAAQHLMGMIGLKNAKTQ